MAGEKFYIMGGTGGKKLWYNDLHVFDTGMEKLVNIMFSVANFFISIFSQFPNNSNSLFLQIVKKSSQSRQMF